MLEIYSLSAQITFPVKRINDEYVYYYLYQDSNLKETKEIKMKLFGVKLWQIKTSDSNTATSLLVSLKINYMKQKNKSRFPNQNINKRNQLYNL